MNSNNGYKWKSWRKKPKQNETLHAWKNIIPSESEEFILEQELDAYRKLNSDGKIIQFNIISEIIGDSVSMKSGKLFYFNSELRNELNLNEKDTDSFSRSWNLNYIRDNEITTPKN